MYHTYVHLVYWSVDWPFDWLFDSSLVRLIVCLVDRLIDWLIGWLVGRLNVFSIEGFGKSGQISQQSSLIFFYPGSADAVHIQFRQHDKVQRSDISPAVSVRVLPPLLQRLLPLHRLPPADSRCIPHRSLDHASSSIFHPLCLGV